jgi:thioredoxin 2
LRARSSQRWHPCAVESSTSGPTSRHVAIVTCPNCGKKNRVAAASEGVPRCGHCHELLPWLVDADDQSFEHELRTSLPVLVDLWAPWCGPCKWVTPAIEEVATTHKGQLKVIKVNVDQAPQVATRFEVSGIPTLVVMRDGQEVDRIAGAPSKPDLVAWLEHHLAERVG